MVLHQAAINLNQLAPPVVHLECCNFELLFGLILHREATWGQIQEFLRILWC
jgi:hypothetical protein